MKAVKVSLVVIAVALLAGCRLDYKVSYQDIQDMKLLCDANGGAARYYFDEPDNIKEEYSAPSGVHCKNNAEKDLEAPMRDVIVLEADVAQFANKCEANGGIEAFYADDLSTPIQNRPDFITRVVCKNGMYFDYIRYTNEIEVDVDKQFEE